MLYNEYNHHIVLMGNHEIVSVKGNCINVHIPIKMTIELNQAYHLVADFKSIILNIYMTQIKLVIVEIFSVQNWQ